MPTINDLTDEDIRSFAHEQFGEENYNRGRSNRNEARYGAKGSISVTLTGRWRGRFKDWDSSQSGWVVPAEYRPSKGGRKKQAGDPSPESEEQRARREQEQAAKAEEAVRAEAEAAAERARKLAHIQAQWAIAEPIAMTPAEAYLQQTRRIPITLGPDQARWAPRHQHSPDTSYTHPAILFPVRCEDMPGEIVGLAAIRLTMDGKKAEVQVQKPTYHIGSDLGADVYVQFGDPDSPTMVLSEGVETGLSRLVVAPTDLRVCLGALKELPLPEHTRRVELCADTDKVQQGRKLARQYAARDVAAFVVVPPRDCGPKGDLNDVLLLARDQDEGLQRLSLVLSEAEHIQPAKGSKDTRGLKFRHGSDVEIAQMLLERLEDLFGPTVTADNTLWHFTGTQYTPIQGAVMTRHIHSADGAMYVTPAGELAVVKLSKSRVGSIADSMLSYRDLPDFFVERSISAPPVIPCRNGVLVFDPRTGDYWLEDHSRRHRNRHILPGRFLEEHRHLVQGVESGDPEAVREFAGTLLGTLLLGCFRDDEDADQKVSLLQEIMGVVAAGWATRIRSPRAIVALGEKAGNGKSQYSALLRGLVPKANQTSVSPSDFGNEYYTHMLIGVVLNAVDELPEKAIQSDRFKAIITGDTVPARQIYREAGTLRPQALHWLTSNQLPRFRDGVDAGVLRRLLFLRFDRVIPEEEKIVWIGSRVAEEEQDLLLAFSAEGLSRFLRNQDYTIPASSHEVLRQFLEEGDSVRGWLAKCTTYDAETYDPQSGTRLFASEAYEHYREWASEQGIQTAYIVTSNTFGKRISRAVPALPPENQRKSNGLLYYPGIALKAAPEGEKAGSAEVDFSDL